LVEELLLLFPELLFRLTFVVELGRSTIPVLRRMRGIEAR
jgi:hypothetical protein